MPHVRKYYIMEDECVECDEDWRNGRYRITFNCGKEWRREGVEGKEGRGGEGVEEF